MLVRNVRIYTPIFLVMNWELRFLNVIVITAKEAVKNDYDNSCNMPSNLSKYSNLGGEDK